MNMLYIKASKTFMFYKWTLILYIYFFFCLGGGGQGQLAELHLPHPVSLWHLFSVEVWWQPPLPFEPSHLPWTFKNVTHSLSLSLCLSLSLYVSVSVCLSVCLSLSLSLSHTHTHMDICYKIWERILTSALWILITSTYIKYVVIYLFEQGLST